MMRASLARLGMQSRGALAGSSAPAPVYAVLTLDDSDPPDGVLVASVHASLSAPAIAPLSVTLDNGTTLAFAIGATEATSGSFAVQLGGAPFVVAVESYTGGGFASLDVSDSCVVTPGQALEPVRVYKGSLVYAASGSVDKSAILAESFMTGVDPDAVEIDFEAVGAGGAGVYGGGKGGRPGAVAVVTRAWADVPATVAYTVGAGGLGDGGSTVITGLATAAGGIRLATALSPKDRPTGPGQGSANPTGDNEAKRGGKANASIPELTVLGGTGGATGSSAAGHDATTPFEHGGGGAAYAQAYNAGIGGWPGGGGAGFSSVSSGSNPRGGHGAARLHIYAWEIPT
jgi:hypothetical protein